VYNVYSLIYNIADTDDIIEDSGAGYLPWVLKNCSVIARDGLTVVENQDILRRIFVVY
jgi:hypothetical protein